MKQQETFWSRMLRLAITVLTALATALGVQACTGGLAL